MKNEMNRAVFLKVVVIGCSASLIEIVHEVSIHFHRNNNPGSDELENISTLHPGDPVPQLFTAKVLIPGYEPGEQAGFAILNLQWRIPFWCGASVRKGYAVCNFAVGCPQDAGKMYQITGFRIPANVLIPDGELKEPPPGVIFYPSSNHRRL